MTPDSNDTCTCCPMHPRRTMLPVNETAAPRDAAATKALAEHGKAVERVEAAQAVLNLAVRAQNEHTAAEEDQRDASGARRLFAGFSPTAAAKAARLAADVAKAREGLEAAHGDELAARQRMLAAQDQATRAALNPTIGDHP